MTEEREYQKKVILEVLANVHAATERRLLFLVNCHMWNVDRTHLAGGSYFNQRMARMVRRGEVTRLKSFRKENVYLPKDPKIEEALAGANRDASCTPADTRMVHDRILDLGDWCARVCDVLAGRREDGGGVV